MPWNILTDYYTSTIRSARVVYAVFILELHDTKNN